MLEKIVNGFPFVLLTFTALAFIYPTAFQWFQGAWITYSLGGIMLGMGLSLTFQDFKRVLTLPGPILLGTILQFTIMPMLGYSLSQILSLPEPFAIGLILVSVCPGGTASNVITFLAKGNLPLSVTLTSISTFLAIVITPTLATLLIGSRLDVDPYPLFLTTLQVILVPVLLGILLRRYFPLFSQSLSKGSALVSVLLVSLIVSSIISQGKNHILNADMSIFLAVFILHAGGFLLGYLVSLLFYRDASILRTVSIEVGMQNSGLGAVLAKAHFLDPQTAIPSALSSLTHSLLGSFLAAIWRNSTEKEGIDS